MQIAEFLEAASEAILDESVAYARTIHPLKDQEDSVLRDHLPKILTAISADLRRDQSRKEGIDKSHGKGFPSAGTDGSAAESHGRKRALSGLRIEHVVAEYRALRSCVLRLWSDVAPATPDSLRDVGRFNEAVDQALAESVRVYSMEVDRWQQIYLGVLGHDVRGPLNAIALTAEIFAARISQNLQRPTATLLRSTRRMTSLIDSLMEYNRANLAGGMVIRRLPIDLAAACHEEIEIQRAALPDTEIVFETLGGNHGEFDASRIREAVANLVSNAVKYGVPGEPVTVRLAGENKLVRLTVENASVNDIPADELEQLFDPLRSTLPHRSGKERSLGLGLFVVRQIVKVHEGEVTGKSAGKRVTFTITLPRFTVEPSTLFPS